MARWRESCDPCPNHLPIRRFLQHVVAAYTPDRSGTLAGNRAADQEARPSAGLRPRSRFGPANDHPVFSRIDDLPGWWTDLLSANALRFVGIFALALFAALLFVFLRGSLNLPSIGDRWGMSRLLDYEGDSPQELQNEIERLRAQMNQTDERK